MLAFERLDLKSFDWGALDNFRDRTVFQTRNWLAFLESTQKGEPVIAAVKDGNSTVGHFTGLIVRKCGIRILGSPFPGWTTSYMGLNLCEGISRSVAAHHLIGFAFRDLRCLHLEFMDRNLSLQDLNGSRCTSRLYKGFEIDLSRSEEEILAKMAPTCRWSIRKGIKTGVVVEESQDPGFADDYYAQLRDVFAKQKLVPPYGVERVRELIRHMQPTGAMLLLRARDPLGLCIATGIFLGMNDRAFFWGGASWREYQKLRPNELLMWTAMKYWKARRVRFFDLSGGGEYKKKYGGNEICVPWSRISKYPILAHLRDAAQQCINLTRHSILMRPQWADALTPAKHRHLSGPMPFKSGGC